MNKKYERNHLFIDIETLPTQDEATKARVLSKLKAPANYKKQETIDKWIEDNSESAIRKTSFEGKYGNVFCVGVAVNDGESEIIKGNEVDVLRQISEINTDLCNPVLVGHNVREFDIKFLIQRQMIKGVDPLFRYYEPYYQRPILDTMEIFSVNPRDRVSLDDLCFVLGVETPKGDLDGSKVYDYWLEGKYDEIYNYCKLDVDAMRKCFNKLTRS